MGYSGRHLHYGDQGMLVCIIDGPERTLYEWHLDGIVVGKLTVMPNNYQEIWVHADYRRRGIATAMYDAVEKERGIVFQPTKSLTPEDRGGGQQFWEARLAARSSVFDRG